MSDFKLLAIRPLANCDKRFRKNLKPDLIYKFYNNYRYLYSNSEQEVNADQKVLRIVCDEKTPENLYAAKSADNRHIKVNISAIVGKNGSGKSSIIELFFAAVYYFSVTQNALEPNLKSLKESVEEIAADKADYKKRQLELKNEYKNNYELFKSTLPLGKQKKSFELFTESLTTYNTEVKKQAELLKSIIFRTERIKIHKEEIRKIKKELSVEIFYQISNTIFKLTINPRNRNNCNVSIIPSNLIEKSDSEFNAIHRDSVLGNILKNPFDFSNYFFYTIAVNYSHYALNATFLGEWINSLFHKNDGYKAPLVINPMRSDGVFMINSEIDFAKYRLLSNVLIQKSNKKGNIYLTDKQFITKVRFTENKEKIKKQEVTVRKLTAEGQIKPVSLLHDISMTFLTEYEHMELESVVIPFKQSISNYIIQKIKKITERYDGYKKGYQFDAKEGLHDNTEFLTNLLNEESHVAYKIQQAVNFLKHNFPSNLNFKPSLWENVEMNDSGERYFELELDDLLEWMGNPNPSDIIKHIPPGIFNIDFFLSEDDVYINKKEPTFDTLSSGEQQLIHSIQSVIYHINNLQSVHLSKIARTCYSSINIIYDEIELYFHPDYQRQFIQKFLKALENVYLGKKKDRIKSINIIFLTHSPFILSDVPINNIMRLEDGGIHKDTFKTETFAANIHEILASSFFFKENTFIGEYANEYLINLINKVRDSKKLTKKEFQKLEKEIDIIGEPFFKYKLKEMIQEKNNFQD